MICIHFPNTPRASGVSAHLTPESYPEFKQRVVVHAPTPTITQSLLLEYSYADLSHTQRSVLTGLIHKSWGHLCAALGNPCSETNVRVAVDGDFAEDSLYMLRWARNFPGLTAADGKLCFRLGALDHNSLLAGAIRLYHLTAWPRRWGINFRSTTAFKWSTFDTITRGQQGLAVAHDLNHTTLDEDDEDDVLHVPTRWEEETVNIEEPGWVRSRAVRSRVRRTRCRTCGTLPVFDSHSNGLALAYALRCNCGRRVRLIPFSTPEAAVEDWNSGQPFTFPTFPTPFVEVTAGSAADPNQTPASNPTLQTILNSINPDSVPPVDALETLIDNLRTGELQRLREPEGQTAAPLSGGPDFDLWAENEDDLH